MSDQMNAMFNHSNTFIALPGGLGTLKEIFHITSWAQLHIHHKLISLLMLMVLMIICCLFLSSCGTGISNIFSTTNHNLSCYC
jgi:hypothetical protein